jgi:transposase-like protein
MGQHWLLSSEVRDLCSYDIAEFTEEQALEFFCKLRWGSISRQICPECGVVDQHYFRPKRKQWRCKHCDRYFSVTTGTVWADRKLPYKKLLYMLSMFTSSPNGISASDLSRKAKVSYKTAWVFCHKLREAMYRTTDETKFSGEVHIDGGHFGGKPRSGQFRHKAKPQAIADKIKLGKNQGSKRSRSSAANLARKKRNRRIVMVLREVEPGYGGRRTRCFLSKSEDESTARYIADNHIERGALVRTDESPAYLSYSAYYTHQTVEHSKEYSTLEGVNNNQAESYFSRLRRSEYGVFHRMMARYMIDYATEMAWREDHRRETEGQRLGDLLRRSLSVGLSRWWRGYWQGFMRSDEMLWNSLS